jgi:drug/metabolite transporter (DMT)-like permease
LLSTPPDARRTAALTAIALVAFAANSVLCRLALREPVIDAASFTAIRVIAGAALLLIVAAPAGRGGASFTGSWTTAGLLAVYAVPFAFAYTQLSAGTGALILFGSVQVTMLAAALFSAERPRAMQWVGAALAMAGLVYLVLPGLMAPPPGAALLMAIAGISWGLYSLRGRIASNALAHTTGNFVRAVPLVAGVALLLLPRAHVAAEGVILAAASGALTSGLGYVAWYAALRQLSGMHAAVVQLAVPPLAAAGGVLFLSETVSWRLVLSACMVLGGIAVAIVTSTPGAGVRVARSALAADPREES